MLEVIQDDHELGEIAAENNLNPNMVRTWKSEFIKNANCVFNESQSEKEVCRKEAELEQYRNRMLCTMKCSSQKSVQLHDQAISNGKIAVNVHNKNLKKCLDRGDHYIPFEL